MNQPRPGRLSRRELLATALLVAIVFGQAVCWGANSDLLAALAALAEVVCAIVVGFLLKGTTHRAINQITTAPMLLFFAAFGLGAIGLLPYARLDWSTPLQTAAGAQTWSLAPDATILELSKLAGAAALTWTAAMVGSRRRRLTAAISGLLLTSVVYAVISLILHSMDPYTVFGVWKGGHRWRFSATFLNANAAGCFLAALLALAIDGLRSALNAARNTPLVLRGEPLQKAGLMLLCAFTLAAATALTLSRSALIMTAMATALIVLWPSRERLGRSALPMALGSLALLAVVVGAGVYLTGGQTIGRMQNLQFDGLIRAKAYSVIAENVAQSPNFGYGLGAFAEVLAHGRTREEAEIMWNFRAAHNAVLHTVMEGGVIMTGTLSLIIILVIVYALRADERSGVWLVRRGMTGAALVIFGCSSVDIALNVPAVAALALTLAGLTLGGSLRSERPVRARPPAAAASPA